MSNFKIPDLTQSEIDEGTKFALSSDRHRYPKLLHKKGDEFNRVFNFMTRDSYMQPHLHPGSEKIECIHIVSGELATIFFDDQGHVVDVHLLSKDHKPFINVPAFTWHTYIILSDIAITYETMMGVYDPQTWKHFASWAPTESDPRSSSYRESLRSLIVNASNS